MAKIKLTVATDFGTFTRSTARTYTHLVLAKGYRAERLEAFRQNAIQDHRQHIADYQHTLATGVSKSDRKGEAGEWDRQMTAKHLADGSYAQWIVDHEREQARLEALGPITTDRDGWGLADDQLQREPTWKVLGWCGRLDLARKLASSTDANSYRVVKVIDVTTGKEV